MEKGGGGSIDMKGHYFTSSMVVEQLRLRGRIVSRNQNGHGFVMVFAVANDKCHDPLHDDTGYMPQLVSNKC